MIEERVATAIRRPVRSLRRIQTRGYAQAFHAIAELDDGSTAFVKAGAEDVTRSPPNRKTSRGPGLIIDRVLCPPFLESVNLGIPR